GSSAASNRVGVVNRRELESVLSLNTSQASLREKRGEDEGDEDNGRDSQRDDQPHDPLGAPVEVQPEALWCPSLLVPPQPPRILVGHKAHVGAVASLVTNHRRHRG